MHDNNFISNVTTALNYSFKVLVERQPHHCHVRYGLGLLVAFQLVRSDLVNNVFCSSFLTFFIFFIKTRFWTF